MRKWIGWLWIVGLFGLVAAAGAQTPSPPAATTQFDGTYAFVSATKVSETYTTGATEHIIRCGDYTAGGPLTIVNGRAYYEGTVGSQGSW